MGEATKLITVESVSVFCDQRMTAVVHPMCDFHLSAAWFHSHFHGDNEDLYWRRAKFIHFPACSFELADMAKWSHTHNAQNSTGSCRMYLRCITPSLEHVLFVWCHRGRKFPFWGFAVHRQHMWRAEEALTTVEWVHLIRQTIPSSVDQDRDHCHNRKKINAEICFCRYYCCTTYTLRRKSSI